MSIFIKTGFWIEKQLGLKSEFNLTRYITELISNSPIGTTPNLQQVTEAGNTTNQQVLIPLLPIIGEGIQDRVALSVTNTDFDSLTEQYTGTGISGIGNTGVSGSTNSPYGIGVYGNGDSDGTGVSGNGGSFGVRGESLSGNGVYGYSRGGDGVRAFSYSAIGIVAGSAFSTAGYFNIFSYSEGNIVEFAKNNVRQAFVMGDGTIVGNRLLINTTDPSGTDALKVEGSGYFLGKIKSQEGKLELGHDGSDPATEIQAFGSFFRITRPNGNYFEISDFDGLSTNTSFTAPLFKTPTGTSSQILLADGSTSSLNDKIIYKLKSTYALMIADGTPTVATIYSITNDENKSYTRSTYLWKPNGKREWIASTPDN